jgi:type I restriction enzyme, S subunit
LKIARVGDVLRLERRPVTVDPLCEYKPIGIRSFGNGIFHYPSTRGSDLSKLRYFEVHPGALVVSNIKAWEGAVAVAGDAENGCVASNRFLSYFPIDDDQIDVRYAAWFFLSERGLPLLQRASPGSADRNRTLAIERFENLELPLPHIDEQRRIVARLVVVLDRAEAIERELAKSSPARIVSIYPGIIQRTLASRAEQWSPVGELVDFVNDLVRPGEAPEPAEVFVGLQHIESHTGRRIGSIPLGGEKGRKFRFQPGDIVYGYLRPYLNKVWVADMHGLCSVDQYVLRPKNGLPAEYLAHALRSRSTLEQAIEMTHNLQLPRLRSGLLANIEIPMVAPDRFDEVAQALDGMRATIVQARAVRLNQEALVDGLRKSALNSAFADLHR